MRHQHVELEGCEFFHGSGISDLEELIAVVYDLAYFWKTDPELMMSRELDVITESILQTQRINQILQGE
ncbi:hypothetical protein DA456_22570 [Pseudomonas syringae pv. atrofaciens]|uniref:Uncharacterized protein n=1 Tax=Pseudomonas syringae pv. atrofaciens TaxID=192087 RepID=A0AAD0IDW6_PSESX|nr:hypothetical protein [Pseudomonas syringae]AVX25951.1 hypothetical protein DA456_22570 [Pseudomonas syringae pv. atrofaciens]